MRPRRSSLTHCSPARKKINRQLPRIERALNHSKQTTELRINRQLSRGPSFALFHSIDASPRHPAPNYSMRNIGANKRLIATHPNSKITLTPSNQSKRQFLTATRIPNHDSGLTSFTTLASQLPPLPALPLWYSHRVPPNGLRALAPTRPMVSGSLPLFPAKEVILCAF
jgi:hypothetical protein